MGVCNMTGCGRPSVARGLCAMHYSRLRHHRNLDARQKAKVGEGRFIGFRCNAEEREAIDEARGEKTISEWVREAVLDALSKGEKK